MDPKLSISSLHLERKRPDQTLDEIGGKNCHLLAAVIVCSLSWAVGAMQMMTGAFTKVRCDNCTMTSIVEEFDLQGDKAHLADMSTSFFMIGNAIGGSTLTHLGDRYGRRPVLLACLLLQAFAAFAAAYAPSIEYFALFRLIHGAFYTGSTMLGWVAAYEHSTTGLRGFTTFIFGLSWVVGYCAVAPLAQLSPTWRHLVAAAGAPIFIVFGLSIFLVPETLHFLVGKRKRDRVEQWLRRVDSAVLSDALKLVDSKDGEKKPITKLEEVLEEEILETSMKNTMWSKFCEKKIFILYFVIQMYLWTCDSFIYFGLSLYSTQLAGNIYTNYLAMGIIELPAYIITPITLEKYGRKKVVMLTHLIAAFSFLANLVFDGEVWTLCCWLVGKLAISCSFMSLFVFASELFPTEIRNVAVGLCTVIAKGGGIMAPYISILGEYHPHLPAIILSVTSGLAGLLTVFLPETHNKPLPSRHHKDHF